MASRSKRRSWSAASWASNRLDFLDQLIDVKIAELMSLTELRNGTNTQDDVLRLKSMTIVAQVLNPSITTQCQRARDLMAYGAMLQVFEQHDRDRTASNEQTYEQALDLASEIAFEVCPVP